MSAFRARLLARCGRGPLAARLIAEPRSRAVAGAALLFAVNLLYALYNGALGIAGLSVWFLAMCAYYSLLSAMRFSVVLCERRNSAAADDMEYFVMRLTGGLLTALSLVLSGVIYISLAEQVAAQHETIVMITIAAYTFYKLTMLAVRAVKYRKNPSPLLAVIRKIAYADVAASVFTLQRSMLVSFGAESNARNAFVLNILTGAAVCLFVGSLGLSMVIKGKRKEKPCQNLTF